MTSQKYIGALNTVRHNQRTGRNHVNDLSLIPSTEDIQLMLTLKMTTAQVLKMSVTVLRKHLCDNHIPPTYDKSLYWDEKAELQEKRYEI